MLRRLLTSVLAAIAVFGAAVTAEAAMHATKEFEQGATRPRSIAFLPPQAMLIKRKIVQTEQQIEESGDLAGYLGASVEAAFKAQGYEVRMLTPTEVGADPELQEMVLDASRRYSELLTQLRTRLPRQIAKRRYEAGDEMRLLAAKLGVDAVGFAEIQIYAAAAGASAVSILTGFGASGEHADLGEPDRRRNVQHRGVFRAARAAARLDGGLRRHHGRPRGAHRRAHGSYTAGPAADGYRRPCRRNGKR